MVLCCDLLQAEDGGHEEQLVAFDKYVSEHVSVPVYELPALSKSIRAENILSVCVCAVMMIGVRPPLRQRTWP